MLIAHSLILNICIEPDLGASDNTGVSERVLSQLLNEIDGIQSKRELILMACTNRLDLIDPALLRPGTHNPRNINHKANTSHARPV